MITPNKNLGQNFLHNTAILKKIVQAADLSHSDRLLEIGPGTGNLTRVVLENNIKKLHALEKDKRFIADLEIIKKQHAGVFSYSIADATQIDFQHYMQYNKLIANLAYNIAGYLLRAWIKNPNIFSRYIITIQREMADRIMSKPHNKTYGKLSVMMQIQFHLDRVLNIKNTSFFPVPKVEGTALVLRPKNHNISVETMTTLMFLLDLLFSSRRKKICNLLRQSYFAQQCQKLHDFDLQQRPENLSPSQFVNMAQKLSTKSR